MTQYFTRYVMITPDFVFVVTEHAKANILLLVLLDIHCYQIYVIQEKLVRC